jgi:hypothetical protein
MNHFSPCEFKIFDGSTTQDPFTPKFLVSNYFHYSGGGGNHHGFVVLVKDAPAQPK